MKDKERGLNKNVWTHSKMYSILLIEKTYELHFNQCLANINLTLDSWSVLHIVQVFISLIQWGVWSKMEMLWFCLEPGIYDIFSKNNFGSKMIVLLWIVSLKFDQREECFYLTSENVILASTHREEFSRVVHIVEGAGLNYILCEVLFQKYSYQEQYNISYKCICL